MDNIIAFNISQIQLSTTQGTK